MHGDVSDVVNLTSSNLGANMLLYRLIARGVGKNAGNNVSDFIFIPIFCHLYVPCLLHHTSFILSSFGAFKMYEMYVIMYNFLNVLLSTTRS